MLYQVSYSITAHDQVFENDMLIALDTDNTLIGIIRRLAEIFNCNANDVSILSLLELQLDLKTKVIF